jgi:cytosine/adenosine deaminase-related metal-dependent hydrolase
LLDFASDTMTTLLINAWLLTIDPDMTAHQSGWLQIDGTTITALGSGAPPNIPGAEVIDCGGDIVMPGMVNTHCHMAMSVFRGLAEDIDDRLYRYILPLERKYVTRDMVRAGTALSAVELIQGGVTTVADMYYFETEVGRVVAESGLRAVVGQTLADFNAPDHATFDQGFELVEEVFNEFSGHALITPSIAPHAPYSVGLKMMGQIARWSDAHPTALVQMHLAESDMEVKWARETYGASSVELVKQSGLLKSGLIGSHSLHLSDIDIELIAAADVRIATNPRSNGKAGRGIARVETLRKAGVAVGIGTDGPMSGNTLDLFSQLAPLSMFAKLRGKSRLPLPASAVIRMATIDGAKVLSLDARTGSLEPGKQADLIRLSLAAPRLHPIYDPYSMLVFAALPTDVTDTMVAGRWLMRDRQVQSLDPKKALRDALQIAHQFKAEMTRIDAAPHATEGR